MLTYSDIFAIRSNESGMEPEYAVTVAYEYVPAHNGGRSEPSHGAYADIISVLGQRLEYDRVKRSHNKVGPVIDFRPLLGNDEMEALAHAALDEYNGSREEAMIAARADRDLARSERLWGTFPINTNSGE